MSELDEHGGWPGLLTELLERRDLTTSQARVAMSTILAGEATAAQLIGFVVAGRWISRGQDMFRMAARGLLTGVAAFTAVALAGAMGSQLLFFAGAFAIGLGTGLFAVSTLTAAMALPETGRAGRGLALGAWGAAQATAAGLSIFLGGTIRDIAGHLAASGTLGPGLTGPAFGYTVVYQLEIVPLFVTLVALGPLVRVAPLNDQSPKPDDRLRIVDFPT